MILKDAQEIQEPCGVEAGIPQILCGELVGFDFVEVTDSLPESVRPARGERVSDGQTRPQQGSWDSFSAIRTSFSST